jgi:hypothetical protein
MANNENYEKDSRQKLIDLLIKCGWRRRGRETWEKDRIRLLVDDVGVYLFQWVGHWWKRTHGRAHASMWKVISTQEMIFGDGARLHLTHGVFTPPECE